MRPRSSPSARSVRSTARQPRPGGDQSHTGGTLGNLIADAQLEASRKDGAQIAFMNPFGIRAPLDPGADGMLTFGDIYRSQPFTNTLVTQTMSGAEIKAVLEQGFDADGPEQVLAPSAGFTFRYDTSRPLGDRVTTILFGGKPLDIDGELPRHHEQLPRGRGRYLHRVRRPARGGGRNERSRRAGGLGERRPHGSAGPAGGQFATARLIPEPTLPC